MKKLLHILLFLPLFHFGQNTLVSLSFGSERSITQYPFIYATETGNIEYMPILEVDRTTSISLSLEQLIGEGFGQCGFDFGLTYLLYHSELDFTNSGFEYLNSTYKTLTQLISPYLRFNFYLISDDDLDIFAYVGSSYTLQEFYLDYNDSDLEVDNSISPYVGAGARLSLFGGLLDLKPYIQYLIQPIYFASFSEISGDLVDDSLSGDYTGVVTGVNLTLTLVM